MCVVDGLPRGDVHALLDDGEAVERSKSSSVVVLVSEVGLVVVAREVGV